MGLITDIQPPDLETRMAILRKKAEKDPYNINEGVLTFIAENITDNIRELEGALIRVTAYSSLTQQPLSVDLARRVLGDIVSGQRPRPITARRILDKTCEMFEFPNRRDHRPKPPAPTRHLPPDRHVRLTRELTDLSYPAIAREFGGRDHTTVIHAVEKHRHTDA